MSCVHVVKVEWVHALSYCGHVEIQGLWSQVGYKFVSFLRGRTRSKDIICTGW